MSEQTDTPRTDAAAWWADPGVRVVDAETCERIERQLNESRAEIAKLREIFPKALEACDNGAMCSPDSSLEYLAYVPKEVGSVVRGLKQQRDRLAELLAEVLDNAEKVGRVWFPYEYRRQLAAIIGKEAA